MRRAPLWLPLKICSQRWVMRKMWSDEVLEVMLAGKRSNLAMYSARELQLVPARAKQAHFVHQYMNVGRGEDVFERGPLAFRPTIACVHLPHMRLGTQRGAAHPLPLAGARDRTLVLGQMRRGKSDRDDVSSHGTDLCACDADEVAS